MGDVVLNGIFLVIYVIYADVEVVILQYVLFLQRQNHLNRRDVCSYVNGGLNLVPVLVNLLVNIHLYIVR